MPPFNQIATLPFPAQTDRTSATILRGHRMGLLRDGWLLLFENNERPPGPELHDQLCIVRTVDRETLCRIVRKGRRPGTWDLLTATGEQMLDVTLLWAERVTMIIPYEPSAQLTIALVETY